MDRFNQIFQSNCNMLDIIFNARAEILATMIERDIDTIKCTTDKTDSAYYNFKSSLDKIPDDYNEIKRQIIDAFNEHTNALEYREGYFNEKYYKEGIKDGINIIVKCFSK